MSANKINHDFQFCGRRVTAFSIGAAFLVLATIASAEEPEAASLNLQHSAITKRGAKMKWGRTTESHGRSASEAAINALKHATRVAAGEPAFAAIRETRVPTGTLVDVQQKEQGLPVFNSRA